MKINRVFVPAGTDPYSMFEWGRRSSKVQNVDGSLVSEMADVEAPTSWSQMSVDICVTKYFRKAGVPSASRRVPMIPPDVQCSYAMPEWLWPSVPAHNATFGSETSVRQVVHRIVGCWTYWGFISGYFEPTAEQINEVRDWYEPTQDDNDAWCRNKGREDNAKAFYDECVYAMLASMFAPNSPQFFSTGISWAYGITGDAAGQWYVPPIRTADPAADEKLEREEMTDEHPNFVWAELQQAQLHKMHIVARAVPSQHKTDVLITAESAKGAMIPCRPATKADVEAYVLDPWVKSQAAERQRLRAELHPADDDEYTEWVDIPDLGRQSTAMGSDTWQIHFPTQRRANQRTGEYQYRCHGKVRYSIGDHQVSKTEFATAIVRARDAATDPAVKSYLDALVSSVASMPDRYVEADAAPEDATPDAKPSEAAELREGAITLDELQAGLHSGELIKAGAAAEAEAPGGAEYTEWEDVPNLGVNKFTQGNHSWTVCMPIQRRTNMRTGQTQYRRYGAVKFLLGDREVTRRELVADMQRHAYTIADANPTESAELRKIAKSVDDMPGGFYDETSYQLDVATAGHIAINPVVDDRPVTNPAASAQQMAGAFGQPRQQTGEPHAVPALDSYTRMQPHACQPASARICTPAGLVTMGEIVDSFYFKVDGDYVARHETVLDDGGETRVVAVKANGIKPVTRIHLSNGQHVDATPDHLVHAVPAGVEWADTWLRVDQLRVGHAMFLHTQATVRQHRYCGIGADGSYSNDYVANDLVAEVAIAGWLATKPQLRDDAIEIETANDDERKWILPHVQSVFGADWYEVPTPSTVNPSAKAYRRQHDDLSDFIAHWGLLGHVPVKRVPERFYTSEDNLIVAFLRSVFQVASVVEYNNICLYVDSRPFLEGVQHLLQMLGIYSSVGSRVLLISYHSEQLKFSERIGFVSADKVVALEELIARGGQTVPEIKRLRITKLEDLGEQEVYDIQTESGKYLCGHVLVHNCFLQPVADNLVEPGGIFDMIGREARIFKFGSGVGTNFSTLRAAGEPLSGGGKTSGLMSWLRIFDRAAGAIQSGGTVRRT
jgi:hypothetical protein